MPAPPASHAPRMGRSGTMGPSRSRQPRARAAHGRGVAGPAWSPAPLPRRRCAGPVKAAPGMAVSPGDVRVMNGRGCGGNGRGPGLSDGTALPVRAWCCCGRGCAGGAGRVRRRYPGPCRRLGRVLLRVVSRDANRTLRILPAGIRPCRGELALPRPVISAVLAVGIMPAVVLIVLLQGQVVAGLAAGGVAGQAPDRRPCAARRSAEARGPVSRAAARW